MEIYTNRKEVFNQELVQLKKKFNAISFFRILSIILALIAIVYYIDTQNYVFSISAAILFVAFIILMRFHNKIKDDKEFKEALVAINTEEITFLKREKLAFDSGDEFIDFTHPYAYDLDIFGSHSLFQNLNRTNTFIGKKTLANQLLGVLPNSEIKANQEAIQELAKKLKWRQEFMAFAKKSQDSPVHYNTLIKWAEFKSKPVSKAVSVLSFLAPTIFALVFIGYLISSNTLYLSALSYLFVFNLIVFGLFYGRISLEITKADNMDKIIQQYGLILQIIENETFESTKLKDLQNKLKVNALNSSGHLKELAVFFSRMESISNFVTTPLFNGLFLFHLHTLQYIIRWKRDYAPALSQWLEVIGSFEALNSLANFSYNNPEFVFPKLNTNYEISFSNLSHPLLNLETRIGNEVDFQPQSFMILTGSNMSGKSTFLRSLGINMVLGGIGSAVCAREASLHPMPVLVSMRLSDSLSDSESYFYAEIKRLKQIMDALNGNRAFVLLDEILRGTNSDDKRSGTIEVIKKMIAKEAIGAIATHDIEVCLTTDEYPNQLINKCFEVEIIDDDLHFDYKLHDGICQNKSATFLMKKMGVI